MVVFDQSQLVNLSLILPYGGSLLPSILVRFRRKISLESIIWWSRIHVQQFSASNFQNSCEEMSRAVEQRLASLYRTVRFLSGQPSQLLDFDHSGDLCQNHSSQGVRQGNPLGPFIQISDHLSKSYSQRSCRV